MQQDGESRGTPCCRYRNQHSNRDAHESPTGVLGCVSYCWQFFWAIIARNKFAIAIASLVWLLWRSGTQPRRLAYPCQQAAAANLGFLAVLFIPEMARRHAARRKPRRRAFALATGSVALAGVLALLISAGVSVYSQWMLAGLVASIPAGITSAPAAKVGIHQTDLDVKSLTVDDVEAMVRKAVADAGGLDGIVQAGDSVAIKPNLVNDNVWVPSDPTGVTTDPRVVAAVVKLAKEAGAATVTIVEGTAGPYDWNTSDPVELDRHVTWRAYQRAGYDADADGYFDYDETVALIDLNDAGTGGLVPRPVTSTPPNTELVTIPNGVLRTEYYVPKAILRPDQGGTCDVFISVPVLKNHGNGGTTGALKNRVGCAPSDIYHVTEWVPTHSNQMKWDLVHWSVPFPFGSGYPTGAPPFPRNVTHSNPPAPSGTASVMENLNVHYSIVDLNLVRPNDFAVIDGLVGITNGPTGTNTPDPYMAMILASQDSVAIDTIATLIMGYDPLQNLHIGWAWNRGLGTRETSLIEVVGDHVADVRRQFTCGYGGLVCVETVPPDPESFDIIEPLEGGTVFGDVPVIATASDNVGLSKAELRVKRLAGENLMVNGDFEGGSVGWTPWKAPDWGSGETWDFENTEPGHLGTQCLHLSSGHASFGVYQEVPVTPGKTYKIDAYWKGQKLGPDGAHNWYEVLILDGPWDYGQADGNPNVYPYDDPSQPVFNEMYGYDSHTYAMVDDFGWEWTHDLNGTPVDTKGRNGLRTASGDVMTVVLKAGACCDATGSSGWFDDISLVEVGDEEELVATLPDPGDPFEIVWHSTEFLNGEYELKLTVYDIALNETTKTRRVFKTDIPGPIISLDTETLSPSSHITTNPADDAFAVWNSGVYTLSYKVEVDQPWLSVYPETAESDGEADTITVYYDTSGLLAGTYTATITVTDNGSVPEPAQNTETIAVTLTVETVKPDFNGDGDVDMEDFGNLQQCLSGAGIPQNLPECLDARLDTIDDDVDEDDIIIFWQCLSGPGVLADPSCDD